MKLPTPDHRAELLTERQRLKMARSAHAYVRGSTVKFYEWLREASTRSLPEGPPVWICGDCHVGNLGPVADTRGEVEIAIRDLDQTVIGNPAHDVIRLALSLASAARGSDLPGVTTAQMIEQIIAGYQAALLPEPARDTEATPRPKVVKAALRTALKRDWRQLARERTGDLRPAIPLGKRFWPLSDEERDALAELVDSEAVRGLIATLRSRPREATARLVDAAYWVKGCSSLGRLRYALLAEVEDAAGERGLSLIDVKEAIKPAAPRAGAAGMPRDNGRRVVEGARALTPPLGERMAPARLMDRAVFVRELLPQDLKLELETLTVEEAGGAARYLAGVVGRAHARQMDGETRERWAAELDRNRSKSLDAPSWLWSSVLELLASHETAYLEHCRRYCQVEA